MPTNGISKLYTTSLCATVCIVFSAVSQILSAREWRDATGRFSVDATFVAADDEHVVLESVQDELIMIRHDELSERDRQYLARRPRENDTTSKVGGQADDRDDPGETQKPKQTTRRIDSTWNLSNGKTIKGHLLGFGTETLKISRVRGDILVNGRKIEELPPAYHKIVPSVVSVDSVST